MLILKTNLVVHSLRVWHSYHLLFSLSLFLLLFFKKQPARISTSLADTRIPGTGSGSCALWLVKGEMIGVNSRYAGNLASVEGTKR
jgi:hypothetical protein